MIAIETRNSTLSKSDYSKDEREFSLEYMMGAMAGCQIRGQAGRYVTSQRECRKQKMEICALSRRPPTHSNLFTVLKFSDNSCHLLIVLRAYCIIVVVVTRLLPVMKCDCILACRRIVQVGESKGKQVTICTERKSGLVGEQITKTISSMMLLFHPTPL